MKQFLGKRIDFPAIQRNLENEVLSGVAFSATDYRSGLAVSFFDGDENIQPWKRSGRRGSRTRIELPRLLASSAIPILFQPIAVGADYYGDGGVALKNPLSPAIHLGAEKISPSEFATQNLPLHQPRKVGKLEDSIF
ncbi:MAG: hypothetical protein H7301_08875 [Cryobacterium sp.]|nr:hypothetical protein [Oligoflexia bacterium]